MPKNPLDFAAMAMERQSVFEVRSRYYDALRMGVTKREAFEYANDPKAKMPKAEAKREVPVQAPPQAEMPQPTPREEREKEEAMAEAEDKPDDLTKINGIGPGTQKRLNAKGVTKVKQIASWSAEDAERFDKELSLWGRVSREDWVGQAKRLAG